MSIKRHRNAMAISPLCDSQLSPPTATTVGDDGKAGQLLI